MRKWKQFVLNENKEMEKRLSKIYRIEKKALDTANFMLSRDLGSDYEITNEFVAFGSLLRCGTCLSSMIFLTNAGYIGSANALLRQVYEYLIWAKITIDTYDQEHLQKLHDCFYDFIMNGRADKLTELFHKVSYKSETLSSEFIIEEGKSIFNQYAFLTHASLYSQQCPVPTEDFYSEIFMCYREIAVWILCYMELIKEHFLRKIKTYKCSDDLDMKELITFGAYNYLQEEIQKQEHCLERIYPKIDTAGVYRIFHEAKWEY